MKTITLGPFLLPTGINRRPLPILHEGHVSAFINEIPCGNAVPYHYWEIGSEKIRFGMITVDDNGVRKSHSITMPENTNEWHRHLKEFAADRECDLMSAHLEGIDVEIKKTLVSKDGLHSTKYVVGACYSCGTKAIKWAYRFEKELIVPRFALCYFGKCQKWVSDVPGTVIYDARNPVYDFEDFIDNTNRLNGTYTKRL